MYKVPNFGEADSIVLGHKQRRNLAVLVMDEEQALGFRIELHMFRHEVGPNGLYCFSAVPCDEYLPAIVKKG